MILPSRCHASLSWSTFIRSSMPSAKTFARCPVTRYCHRAVTPGAGKGSTSRRHSIKGCRLWLTPRSIARGARSPIG